jgi:hypothetical protein
MSIANAGLDTYLVLLRETAEIRKFLSECTHIWEDAAGGEGGSHDVHDLAAIGKRLGASDDRGWRSVSWGLIHDGCIGQNRRLFLRCRQWDSLDDGSGFG